MNFLIVSDREYKKTSRGIDIITSYLIEKGYSVDHLVFFKRKQFPLKQINSNSRQLFFYDPLKLYRSRLQFLFPGFLLLLYFQYIIKKQKSIDFSRYNYVVIESGHPVYLGLNINNKIIYRQSDPTYISFNSNRKFYLNIENQILKKSIFVTGAIKNAVFPEEVLKKFYYWHSGFIPPGSIEKKNKEKCFVILSGELDWSLITKIAKKYPDYKFNIISISKRNIVNDNIYLKGYLDYDEYLKTISSALVAIIPYSKHFAYQHRLHDFTAKIWLPMYMGIPILLGAYGSIQDSDENKKLFVYKSHKEAMILLNEVIKRIESGKLNNQVSNDTLEYLTPQISENRKKELDTIFQLILK